MFQAGRGNAILGPIMGEHSLLLQDGAAHKRARSLLMPAFNGHALRAYEGLVTEVARAEVARWRDGEEFRSLDRMNALTLEVILRVVFGVTDESRLAALRPRVNATVDVSPAVLLGWGYPWLLRFGPWKATVENSYALDRLIYAEIAERRLAPDLAARTDVLSRLIQSPPDRRATRGSAGSGCAMSWSRCCSPATRPPRARLSWTLYLIDRHPAQQARAHAAARDGDPEGWLEAALKESLRLHPIIPMVVRTLTEPATIGGRSLPAGATIGPSILLAHARAENHPDPEAFRPERFLGHNPPPNTWIPFGGGVRRCIGAGFSLMEGVAVLREVFAAVDVRTVAPDAPKVRNITSVPRGGARVRVSR